jgi:hypothetical protein
MKHFLNKVIGFFKREVEPTQVDKPDTTIYLAPQLVESIKQRFPDKLPVNQTSQEELAFLQGQQFVVAYVLEYLHVNEKEIERGDILGNSE